MNNRNLIFLIAIVSLKAFCQSDDDVFSFNYTLAPTGNDDVDFYKTDFKLSVPLKKDMLSNTMAFNYYQFDYYDTDFDTGELSDLYDLSYNLSHTYLLGDKWNINSAIGVSLVSNLEGSVSFDDMLVNGSLAFIKRGGSKEKPSQFTFGAMYSTITGKPRVLPIISYEKKVNEKFSYQLGFPKTFVEYKLNIKNTFKSKLELDGYYGNLSNPIYINISEQVNKVSFSSTSLGLEYNYWMGDCWTIVFSGAYSLLIDYKLENNKNDSTYKFNTKNQPYFSTGIKFNL